MDYKMLYNSHVLPGTISSFVETHKTYGYHPRRPSFLEEILLSKISFRNVCNAPSPSDHERTAPRRARYIPEFVSDLCFSPDGMFLIASVGENLHVFDPNRGRIVKSIWDAHDKESLSNLIFYNDKKFCCSTSGGCIGFWDTRKLSCPLNSFKAHTHAVKKVLYDKDLEWLITSDKEGHLHYWYLPAYEIKDVDLQNDHNGSLINCPMLNQMCIVDGVVSKKLVMTASNNGSLYIIDNLNFELLARNSELKRVNFCENFRLFLGMNPRIGSVGILNQLHYIDQEDYIPVYSANISGISYMESFQNHPSILMRLTTKKSLNIGAKTNDWTVCVKLKERARYTHTLLKSFGSDVLNESLLYASEESKFCALKEKKNCISCCGRLVASPQRTGIQLLSFSKQFNDVKEVTGWKKTSNVTSIFWPKGPQKFNEVVHINSDIYSTRSFPLCCKFSPLCCCMLAVGDSLGRVSFYQPKL